MTVFNLFTPAQLVVLGAGLVIVGVLAIEILKATKD